jgi:hypothetical protein
MFEDEKTLTTIYAPLNDTLIRGTLRTQDLVPVFLEAIVDTPEYLQILQSNIYELGVIFDISASDDDERWESEYMSYFLNETLFDTLNTYAPDGYYFGAHEGDGSDFGYWEIIED